MVNLMSPNILQRPAYGTMVLGAGLLALACPVGAAEFRPGPAQGAWLVRVMALEITSVHTKSDVSSIGGEIKTPGRLTPGVDISYLLTHHWALEFQGGVIGRDYRIAKSRIGDFEVGNVDTAAAALAVQYRFRPYAKLNPYLGLGVCYAWERKTTPALGIPDFEVDAITSTIVNLGLDYRLTERLFFSASARYLISPTYQFDGEGFNAAVRMDTLIVGAGMAYRF